jgi:Insulinase (Peptidase family M16)
MCGGKMFLKMERAVRALAMMAATILASGAPASAGPSTPEYKVPVEYYKLANGLRVVLSPDHTSPTICVGVYYHIGFRIEPRDRTGFAHLFEHMMFQGSQNLGKMEFVKLVQQNGGILNGSTRFDFTNYFETLPSNKLETALWAEADRMGGLAVNEDNLKNQQGVVGNEVKVNVLNSPYGGFPWLDMPQYPTPTGTTRTIFTATWRISKPRRSPMSSHFSRPTTRRIMLRWRLSAILIRRKPRNSWINISGR